MSSFSTASSRSISSVKFLVGGRPSSEPRRLVLSLGSVATMAGTDGRPAKRILEEEPALKLMDSSVSLDMGALGAMRQRLI